MSLISKALDLFTLRRVTDQLELRGAFDPDRVLPQMTRRANWADADQQARLIDISRKSVTVYACLSLLADAVSEAVLMVYRKEADGSRTEQPAHACRQVIERPNPFMSEAAFKALMVMQMGFFGWAPIEKVRSGAGLPVELWPLRTDWLSRRPTQDGLGVWSYRAPGQPERLIPLEDIIIVPYRPDPLMQRFGVGPLQVAGREIGIDSALTDFLKVFLDNGGIPPFVLEHPDPIPDRAIVEAMQEEWAQKYGGSKAYGKLPVLHGGYQIKQIGNNVNDMAWPDLRGLTELKICQAFRIPAGLVQAHKALNSGSLTTTEQDGDMTFLQRYAAEPLRRQIDDNLTVSLLHEFTGGDPNYELAFDTSEVLALQEDQDKKHTRVRADWDAGLIMQSEARAELGLPDLGKETEVFKVPFTTLLVPASGLSYTSPDETETNARPQAIRSARYFDAKAASPKQLEIRASLITMTNRDRGRLIQILDRQMRKFWKAQGKRIVDALPKSAGEVETRAEGVNWGREDELLREVMGPFYEATGKAAFTSFSQMVDAPLAWDLANPNIARVLDSLGTRIEGINETTRSDVADTIEEWSQSGGTLQDLADSLGTLFEETYKGRAMTVARTETQVAYNTASQLAYEESGEVDEVEMVDNLDHDEDYGASDGLTCAQRDGMIVIVDDMPKHIDAEHPNGSLAFIPILRTQLGET